MEDIHVTKHDNFPSIEHTLRPISYTSWLMGVGIAHPLKCPKFVTIVIRIIHLVMCTVFLTIFIRENVLTLSMNTIIHFGWVIVEMTYFVAAYYYIYHGIRQYDTWSELMDKMKELDRKIRKETHMNDQPVKIMKAVAILMTFVCCPLIPMVFSLCDFMSSYGDRVIESLSSYYMMAQSTIYSFFFGVVVYVMYYRYQTVNKMFGHLDKLSDAPLIALKIRRIRELHNDICDLVMVINNIHSLYFLLCSANCFAIATAGLCYGYVYFTNEFYVSALLHSIFPISVVYTMQFGLICWICKLARQEFDKTKIIMCAIALKYQSMNFDKLNDTRNKSSLEVRLSLEDADSGRNFNQSNSHDWNYVIMENLLCKIMTQDHVNTEINGFLIQLQHRRVLFKACDFFEMNNNLFCGFVGVIFTYLIIFIQFASEPKDLNENRT
ncbi:uncharacterized protein LOC118648255 [Monomorium pharaonis]|uniref:uncharacterized protein LOC118646955 n=1 Tax=Monomorium pharaonis TaxID=307658 RepID=UPI001745E408|nr:uncharacterized protein LOC118646955 [Monomorium pharaonis]XP_036150466.1 uncharacterized protein LOC118648255 [Monomorium pharaonis]